MRTSDGHLPESVGTPGFEDGLVFREPWEAQAFAFAVHLSDKGVFSWTEWVEALSQQIARARVAGEVDDSDTYYGHWLAALESVLIAKGITSADDLAAMREAFVNAARATPHGQPIRLASR